MRLEPISTISKKPGLLYFFLFYGECEQETPPDYSREACTGQLNRERSGKRLIENPNFIKGQARKMNISF